MLVSLLKIKWVLPFRGINSAVQLVNFLFILPSSGDC